MKKVKLPWRKISSEIAVNYCGQHYQCPDCKRTIIADPIEIFGYRFCPICGKQRYEDEAES